MALTLASLPSPSPIHHQTIHQLPYTKNILIILSARNLRKADTWVLSQGRKSKTSSGLSSRHQLASYRNQESQENSVSYKTSRIPTRRKEKPPQSTVPSTQMSTRAHGEPSQSSAFSSNGYLLARKQQSEMWRKLIARSQSNPASGLVWLYGSARGILLPLTPVIASALRQAEVAMERLGMQEPNSCEHSELDLCSNGLTIISSSASYASTGRHITTAASSGQMTLHGMEESTMTGAAYGSKAASCRVATQRSLRRTMSSPFRIFRSIHPGNASSHSMLQFFHITNNSNLLCLFSSQLGRRLRLYLWHAGH